MTPLLDSPATSQSGRTDVSIIDRHAWPIAIGLIAPHVALAWLARVPAIFSDQAVYVALSRALRDFHYHELFRIDLPVHRMYPPGYPLLLAVWSAIGGERFDWLVLVGLGSSAAALLLFFAAVRNRWGSVVASAALLALVFNADLIQSSGWLVTEAPYMLFATVALWAVSRERDTSNGAVLAGAAAIIATFTRSAGVSLVVALGLYWLWRRRYRWAFLFSIAAVCTVGSWLAFTALAPEQVPGGSYLADAVARPAGASLFQAIVYRAANKLPYLQSLYDQMEVPTLPGTIMDNLIGVPIVGAGLAVGLFALFVRWPAAAMYLIAYGALLLGWPWTISRFLTPVLPLFVLSTILGISQIVAIVRPHWQTPALFLVAGVLALTGLAHAAETVRLRQRCDRAAPLSLPGCLNEEWAGFFAASQYVRERVAPDAVFVSGAPASLYLFTGRRTVSMTRALSQPPAEFLAFLGGHAATHILLSAAVPFSYGRPQTGGHALAEMVRANCQLLQLEASFPPSAHLFRLPLAGERADPDAACRAVDSFIERYRVNR